MGCQQSSNVLGSPIGSILKLRNSSVTVDITVGVEKSANLSSEFVMSETICDAVTCFENARPCSGNVVIYLVINSNPDLKNPFLVKNKCKSR